MRCKIYVLYNVYMTQESGAASPSYVLCSILRAQIFVQAALFYLYPDINLSPRRLVFVLMRIFDRKELSAIQCTHDY
jgi:hypothetical protein